MAWLALFEVHCAVELESQAIAAMQSLTDDQLRAIRWIGLLDDGWARVSSELAARGATL